jgi:hypothetical protein
MGMKEDEFLSMSITNPTILKKDMILDHLYLLTSYISEGFQCFSLPILDLNIK